MNIKADSLIINGVEVLDKIGKYISMPADTSSEGSLNANCIYNFGEVATLSITLGDPSETGSSVYIFSFDSGPTATTLTLPSDITWQDEPSIEANNHYEFNIMKCGDKYYGLYQAWEL